MDWTRDDVGGSCELSECGRLRTRVDYHLCPYYDFDSNCVRCGLDGHSVVYSMFRGVGYSGAKVLLFGGCPLPGGRVICKL